jgi:thymidylate kinase
MIGSKGLLWVSLEGRNGVGKTHLAALVSAGLGKDCVALAELTDTHPDSLPARIIATLSGDGDPFLRGAAPMTETLLLAALQVHRHETTSPGTAGLWVLEDRGPLTVAVYQAAILEPHDDDAALVTARRILAAITDCRPLPQLTVLLRDDPQACLRRFALRIGRAVLPDEIRLMARASDLYDRLAAEIPGLTVLDRRGHTDTATAQQIIHLARAAVAAETRRAS